MKHYLFSALCVLLAYLALIGPFTRVMAQKPYAVKLGVIPHPKVLQVLFPDYQELLGANVLGRIILYYGTLTGDQTRLGDLQLAADYPAMSRAVHTALRLDPYNMDGYYFGQSILVWNARQYQLANELLEYGMQYRTWDWQLPFFAAFNNAYLLDLLNAIPDKKGKMIFSDENSSALITPSDEKLERQYVVMPMRL